MTQQNSGKKWYDTRNAAIAIACASALIAYGVGSRAIFTGSLQQYIIAFVSLVLAVNRFAATVKSFKRKQA